MKHWASEESTKSFSLEQQTIMVTFQHRQSEI